MDLAAHINAILKHWWQILLAALVAAVFVHWVSGSEPSMYQSSASLSVSPGRSGSGPALSLESTLFLTRTYSELASTEPVAVRAVEDGALDLSTDEVLDMVSASAADDIGFLTVSASGEDPKLVAEVANAVSQALIVEVRDRQTRAVLQDLQAVTDELATVEAELEAARQVDPESPQVQALSSRYDALLTVAVDRRATPLDRIEVLSDAEASSSPVSPSPTRDAVLAFIAALIVAAEATVALAAFSPRIDGEDLESVTRLTGLPVLAQVPRGTREEVAEAFRALRTSLYVSNNLAPPASTAIVSATAKAGKSFTAIRFAEAVATGFSQQGVVLVDGDCRRPVLHERLHTRRTPGLTDALQGASVASVLVDVMSPSGQPYHLMPSGTTVDDPVALLSGPRFARLVASLGDARAPVIIDTPPVGLFTDPLAIAAMCDATVLVIDARTSRKRQVVRTVESLRRSGATLAGVIVNRTRPDRSSRYYEEGAGTDGKARPRTIRRPADLS